MKRLLFLLSATALLFTSCVKDNDDDNLGEYYFKVTIDGVTYQETATADGPILNGGGQSMLGDEAEIYSHIGPESWPSPNNATFFYMGKGILSDYFNTTDARFTNFFPLGTSPYSSGTYSDHFQNADGIALSWIDKNQEAWHSCTGSQSGSTFEIVSREEKRDPYGQIMLKIKARFSCKLYKEDTNEMVQLTNGEYVGLFSLE